MTLKNLWLWIGLVFMMSTNGQAQDTFWVRPGDQGGCLVCNSESDEAPCHAIQASVVSRWQSGILAVDEKGTWKSWGEPEGPVPQISSNANWVFAECPHMQWPFLVFPDGVEVYRENQWARYPIPCWVEFLAPNWQPGSQHGFTINPPLLVSLEGHAFLAYQPQSGVCTLVEDAQGTPQQVKLRRHMRLLKVEGNLLWIGRHDEDRVALSSLGTPLASRDRTRIEDLNRHSLVFGFPHGAWIITFKEGISDAIHAWEKGEIDVVAHMLRVRNRSLSIQSWSLDDLPMTFDLGQSSSGSPRLVPQPAFRIFPIHHTSWLLVHTGKQYLGLDGTRPPTRLLIPDLNPSDLVYGHGDEFRVIRQKHDAPEPLDLRTR